MALLPRRCVSGNGGRVGSMTLMPQALRHFMANIFNFKPADIAPRPEVADKPATVCEVILFPGVRYERWDVTPAPKLGKAQTAKKPRAKKRECELVD
jgi:hypothetical protein